MRLGTLFGTFVEDSCFRLSPWACV